MTISGEMVSFGNMDSCTWRSSYTAALFLGQKSFLNCTVLYCSLSWPAEVSVFAANTLTPQLRNVRIVACLGGSNC
jgi:hypothetical protein